MAGRTLVGGVAVLLATTACTLNTAGNGGGAAIDGDSSTGAVASTSGTTAASPDDGSSGGATTPDVTTGPMNDASTGAMASSTTDEPSDTTSASTGPEPEAAHSCAELLAMDGATPTGVHTLVDAEGVDYEAFCLMDFEGGGWTLVGRSAPVAASEPFGWRTARGSVEDMNDAYSLDAWSRGLSFTELLVTDRTSDASLPFERAYRLGVADDFIENYADEPLATAFAGTLLGDCTPTNPPRMLDYVGYTERDDVFFFRDNMGSSGFGLRANGWGLAHNDCWRGAELNGEQGLLFVR
ncbi:MAG: fibrinogen-like YCDxxxxGGGW domain-containing protein [Myxococcota bacterium]